jgi:adenine deaminase
LCPLFLCGLIIFPQDNSQSEITHPSRSFGIRNSFVPFVPLLFNNFPQDNSYLYSTKQKAMNIFSLNANLIDIPSREIYGATVEVANGIITNITRTNEVYPTYILPGFVDAHVHIESSLLVPSEFARMAVLHGTVATVSDPHEIANVLGMEGVDFMIRNATQVPFHFFFGAPSCVPATVFETAGARVTPVEVDALLQRDEILYLSEMMNFPGVLNNDPEVMAKIASAKKYNKPVDGHAPGLMGDAMKQYFAAGISTDHECFMYDEALEKIEQGVNVIIREGSAARNFETLIPLMAEHASQLMFCSDDKHPDSLIAGHINQLVARALAKGHNLFDVLQAACINPVKHYRLPVGQLRMGDAADFIITDDIQNFYISQTYVKGQLLADAGKSLISSVPVAPVNYFDCTKKQETHFTKEPLDRQPVIECIDGELVTNKLIIDKTDCTPQKDILKLAVVNRYRDAPVALAYIKNFGLKEGSIASSVAHDSHNIIAVGVDDASLCKAVNLIIEHAGGLCAVSSGGEKILPLPVAGLMSEKDAWEVAALYTDLDAMSKQMGSTLRAPFMSLSFMGLLVIPHLKLSDKGLFDGDSFTFVKA